MKLTKQVIAGVLIAGLVATVLVVPLSAEAGGRHWRHGGGHGHGHGHYHGGYAALLGRTRGGGGDRSRRGQHLRAACLCRAAGRYQPAPVVVQPPPVVYQPVCSNYWVNPSWNGYQWVPGYWAQACR